MFDLAVTGLVDFTGASTAMTVGVDFGNTGTTGAGFGGTTINGPSGADPFDEPNAVKDGIFANNNTSGVIVLKFGRKFTTGTGSFNAMNMTQVAESSGALLGSHCWLLLLRRRQF